MLEKVNFQLKKIFTTNMSNEIENQINEELFQDKIRNFFGKNKKKLITLFILIIITPILFQIISYHKQKEKSFLLSEYLRAEYLIEKKDSEEEAIKILINLKDKSDQSISLLSLNRLLEFYIIKGDKLNAIKLLENYNKDIDLNFLKEVNVIKKIILNFDSMKETEIENLIKDESKSMTFRLIKKKLIIDFYIKNNQLEKADLIKKTYSWKELFLSLVKEKPENGFIAEANRNKGNVSESMSTIGG